MIDYLTVNRIFYIYIFNKPPNQSNIIYLDVASDPDKS